MSTPSSEQMNIEVVIPIADAELRGSLNVPTGRKMLVLFAHGSGSSRHSPRNQFVARTLNEAGLATLLFDLLTPAEEIVDMRTRQHRFDIGLLAARLVHAAQWAHQHDATREMNIGYFGSSTGGGAALAAAAQCPDGIAQSSPAAAGRSRGRCPAAGASGDAAHRRR